jgi:hypothetical protein
MEGCIKPEPHADLIGEEASRTLPSLCPLERQQHNKSTHLEWRYTKQLDGRSKAQGPEFAR